MSSTHIQEILDRETKRQKDEKKRMELIDKKRNTPMPGYPERMYDARGVKEVEETRILSPKEPLERRARRAARRNMPFDVKRDKDGAFRLFNRLDGNKLGVAV